MCHRFPAMDGSTISVHLTDEMRKLRLPKDDLLKKETMLAVLSIFMKGPRNASLEIENYYEILDSMLKLYKQDLLKNQELLADIISRYVSTPPLHVVVHRLHGALSSIPIDSIWKIIHQDDSTVIVSLIATPPPADDITRMKILRASTGINNLRLSTPFRSEKNRFKRAADDTADTYSKALAELNVVKITS